MNKLFDRVDGFFEKVCLPKYKHARSLITLLFNLLSAVAMIFLPFMPICDAGKSRKKIVTAIGALDSKNAESSFYMIQYVALIAIAICFVVLLVMLFKNLFKFSDEEELANGAKTSLIFASVVVIVYTGFTFIFSPVNRMIGGYSVSKVSYGAMIYIAIVALLYALSVGVISSYRNSKNDLNASFEKKMEKERKQLRISLFWRQLELQMFAVAMAAVSLIALMSKLVTVKFDDTYADIPDYVIWGKEFLKGSASLETKGERTVAFLIFVLFLMTVVSLCLSVVALISRSSQYNKIAISAIAISAASSVLVGLFGQYYKVVQTLNSEIVDDLLALYGIEAAELLEYKIRSGAMMYCYIAVGILAALILRRPYTKANEIARKLDENRITLLSPEAKVNLAAASSAGKSTSASDASPMENKKIFDGFDPCPAFTELDFKMEKYSRELEEKREALFASPTLPSLVNYIVQYARDSRHHLYYTPEAIATFLAGLGATKLTILQGMSGTGKTSLPKIVSEALMSVCDIVEVESSWRDKNELLGYYNEFNKVYTPRKFTQSLYKASLNSDTLTFIVLDEMNLSRIEYYFSDFLSLMENDPDKREIKLLNTPLARVNGTFREEYAALVDGHTLKIPPNVWFIGTANRDESTYDISDKVYDRAHTMNFDKRAQKPTVIGEPIAARYLPASELSRLFEEAKATVKIDIDKFPVVKRTEELLEPYGISFGNRIAMQIEAFVSVYASCFAFGEQIIQDAFDTILLSKVVKKLELKIVEDKESLAAEFDKIGLVKCARFVMSLKED